MKWLICAVVLASPAVSYAGDKVLGLGSEEPLRDGIDEPVSSLLLRELVRQAVLIAARDELGLATRDQSLREDMPDGRLDVTLAIDGKESLAFRVRRAKKTIFKKELPFAGANAKYDKLVSQLEALSRGELVAALRSADVTGERRPRARVKEPLPDGILDRLDKMTVFDQHAAVRAAHAVAAKKGESPESLAALARGYANLGILTERQWSVAHKVFKARALLYAERLVACSEPESGFALAHRAYARALAGLHGLVPQSTIELEPGWMPLVRAYVQVERPALENAGRHRGLARLLAFLCVEDSGGHELQARLGGAIVEENPWCHRVHDVIADVGPVSSRDAVTRAAFEVFETGLAKRLAALPDAPALAAPGKKGFQGTLAALARAGATADDKGEPSWTALARILEDSAFLAAARRGEFLKRERKEELPDLLARAKLLCREHAYGAFVTSLIHDDSERRRAALEDLTIIDGSIDHTPLVNATWGIGNDPSAVAAREIAFAHADPIERDLRVIAVRVASMGRFDQTAADTKRYWKACPESPLAMALALQRGLERRTGQVVREMAKRSESPDLIEVLARRADERGDEDAAIELWEKRVEISADAPALLALGQRYERARRIDEWKATADRLVAADPRADHDGGMRLRLAKQLIAKGRNAEGLDYVDAAAAAASASGDRATLAFCVGCFEDAGDPVRTERCVKRLSERFTPNVTDWFYWCKRTGTGDVAAARKLCLPDVERWSESSEPSAIKEAAGFWLVDGATKKTVKLAAELLDHTHRPFWGLHVAILSKSAKRREESLDDVTLHRAAAPANERILLPLVKVLASCLEDGEKLDLAAVENLRQASGDPNRSMIDYFVGRFLETRKRPTLARAYYLRALNARSDFEEVPIHGLARDGLDRIPAE